MIETPDGTRYLPSSTVRNEPGYADITPALLATWRRTGQITPATIATIATALHQPIPDDIDPTTPATWPGPSGPEYLYAWPDITAAEIRTRLTRRTRGGRPRRHAA